MRIPNVSLPHAIIILTRSILAFAIRYETRFEGVQWDDDSWSIINRNLDQGHYQSRMSLSNGYLGINVASVGPFFEVDKQVDGDNINGWPLFDRRQTFSTISGFYGWEEQTNGSNYPWLYQYGGESIISGVPHWSGLLIESDGAILNASVNLEDIEDFSSKLDMSSGILSWYYDWKPAGGVSIGVEYNMFVHKLYVNQAAVQLKLTASHNTSVTIYDVLDGDGAVRAEFVDKKYEVDSPTIWSAVRPSNITNVEAYIYSTIRCGSDIDMGTRAEVADGVFGANQSSIAQSVKINLYPQKTVVVEKFVGGASSDAYDDPQTTAHQASLSGAAEGFSGLVVSHVSEWESIMTRDSVDRYHLPNGTLPDDENIQELQIMAVSNPFNVLQNTVGQNAIAAAGDNKKLGTGSIPVCGLGSNCYGGLIFWDAEIWMGPGLQVSHPDAMQQIIRYREERFSQAQENVKMAFSSSQNRTGQFSAGGAVFPWTSGRHGNCTATGPCFDYEYHINGDIAISLWNHYVITGDGEYFKENLLPMYNAIAYFYGELLTLNRSSGFYNLLNATDPDEYANNVNNVGFTMALIQMHLNQTNLLNSWFQFPENQSWSDQASKMPLPVNEEANIILEYDTMNGSIEVKQADVVLIDDILHYENNYSVSNLDYYAAKQSLNGPGMTYGVFSIVASEVSPSGCSCFTYDLYASQPYIRAPWFQYSEQLIDQYQANGGTHPAFPFLTGMGGANRVAIFGYLGLRLYPNKLDIDPILPPQIPLIRYRTFYWQGHGISATSNQTHTTLIRLPPENYTLPNANSTFSERSIPVTLHDRGNYSLSFNQPLTLPNRLSTQKKTVSGNILQCLSNVYSESEYMPGQFPLAAIDGAVSTKWQPAYANETAYISVTLGDKYYPIEWMEIDWGTSPPDHYEVIFSNSSDPSPPFKGDYVNVTSSNNVEITEPYDPDRLYVIETYKGNKTNVTFDPVVWTGRTVHLGTWGNKENTKSNAKGATVAEWVLVCENCGKNATAFETKWPYLNTEKLVSSRLEDTDSSLKPS